MGLSSGFFNSIGADRLYDASDFANYLKDIITNGFLPIEGGFLVTANPEPIGANPPSVIIGVGKAYLNGLWCINDSEIVYNLGTGQQITPGIKYLVYLCFDTTDEGRDAIIGVVTGASPVIPPDTAGLYYLPMALVVDQQDVQPASADITDLRVAAGVASITEPPEGGTGLTDADRTVHLATLQLATDKAVNNQKIDLFAFDVPGRTYAYKLFIEFGVRIAYTGTGVNTTPTLFIRNSTVAYATATATPLTVASPIFVGYPNCLGVISGVVMKAIQWSGSYIMDVAANTPVNLKFTVASGTTVTVYSTGYGVTKSVTHAEILQIPAGSIL